MTSERYDKSLEFLFFPKKDSILVHPSSISSKSFFNLHGFIEEWILSVPNLLSVLLAY